MGRLFNVIMADAGGRGALTGTLFF